MNVIRFHQSVSTILMEIHNVLPTCAFELGASTGTIF